MPAFYFPLQKGNYEVRPGLFPLGTDFGNHAADAQFFQLDEQFAEYRAEKIRNIHENSLKYFCLHQLPQQTLSAVCHFITGTLCRSYPQQFVCTPGTDTQRLDCHLTGESLTFSSDYSHVITRAGEQQQHPLHVLAMQVQEDMAIVQLDKQLDDYLAAMHLCFPNYWAAEDKITRPFTAIHQPVAGIEAINRRHREIINAMIHKGPFVRFAWGLTTDDRLNHHPQPPPGINLETWQGRAFDPEQPELFLRVERQCTQGFAQQHAALFTIRTYLYRVSQLQPQQLQLLSQALDSMKHASLVYKGLEKQKPAIQQYLHSMTGC